MAPNIDNFDHIKMVQDGDTETPIYVSLKGFTPSAGGSGHVDPGNYELEVVGAKWVKTKAKEGEQQRDGRNLLLAAKTSGPEKFSGVPIMSWKPADPGKNGLGLDWFKGLAWALAVHAGKLEAAQAAESIPLSPKNLVGRKFYARIRNGKDEYADRSEIDRFITREEYMASPGPSGEVSAPSMGTPQATRPEMIAVPANGKGVDASMPF